jgi:hypothetical protein
MASLTVGDRSGRGGFVRLGRAVRFTLASVRLAIVCCVVLCMTAALAGCAQSGYDGRKLGTELERTGLTPAQARCVTEHMEAMFDLGQLASHSEPTDRELATTRALIEQCGVTLPPKS